MNTAYLVLDDGRIFEGEPWACKGTTFGEAVFSTGMTGYQETLTDPSYYQQIVVMTAPHIGNTGMNHEDEESRRIWVSGFVVRNPSPIVSNWRAERSLEDDLIKNGVIGIQGIDTRALTLHLRDHGAMRMGIFSGQNMTPDQMLQMVRSSSQMEGSYLAGSVSIEKDYVVQSTTNTKFKVAALDLGIKAATPRNLAQRGIEVHILPVTTTYDQIKSEKFNGLFLSNGPGDPATMNSVIALVQSALTDRLPVFGICFGHQILARALGLETYKLRFGHRGINQPVKNKLKNRVEITAQNHGFAVQAPLDGNFETPFGTGIVTHICLNDGVVEGLKLLDAPAFSVQYHPEAAAGPHDANYLFDDFLELLEHYAKR